METYYQVTYKTEKGIEVKQRRDTVERGHYLYKSLVEDFAEDGIYDCSIKLEEISDNGIALLRAKGEYKPKEIKVDEVKNAKKETEKDWQPKNWVEMLCGMPIEEYNECIDRWNLLTGEKNEHLSV
jgi:hypothetical protein